jgi:hypothetical protein
MLVFIGYLFWEQIQIGGGFWVGLDLKGKILEYSQGLGMIDLGKL